MLASRGERRSILREAEAAVLAAGREGDIEKVLRVVGDYENAKLKYDAAEARILVLKAISSLQAAVQFLQANPDDDVSPARSREATDLIPIFKRFKGRLYEGTLNRRTGEVETGGLTYPAPSPAAMSITMSSANGWEWWRFKDETGREAKIATLR